MKKHLTMPPPSFQSMGVAVPPPLEAVVRHALEKEVSARVDSIPNFLKELRAAMSAAPAVVTTARETGTLDPNRTMVSDLGVTTPPPTAPSDTNFAASFDSLAGTVSASALDEQLQQQLSNTAAEHRRAQGEKEKAERERLAEEQRREAEDRLRKEKLEQAREKEQQEKFDRMAQQAKELEDRLQRLSVSISPNTMIDPETTHVGQGVITGGVATTTSPGVEPLHRSGQVIIELPQKKSGSPYLLIVLATVFVVLVGGGVGAYYLFRPKPQLTVVTNRPPEKTVVGATKPDLIAIDGGTFQMGNNSGPAPERPAHPVTVPSFLMDKTEVTNAEYAEFVRETNHAAPSHWQGNKPPFGQEQWPVVGVTFDDVNSFAAWRSKRDSVTYRLPTEEEWEYAARNGEKDDTYPWGTEWQDNAAVVKEATPLPVGSRPAGKNKWGVVDLIGNVWEWTGTKASVYPGNKTTVPTSLQDWITIRGACYVSDPAKPDAPVTSMLREFVPPSTKNTLLGFRLVRSGQ